MSASSEGRFVGETQAETDAFVESMRNPNTKRKTNSDTHIFKEWLITNNETRLTEDFLLLTSCLFKLLEFVTFYCKQSQVKRQ